jgi:hypothetical protein
MSLQMGFSYSVEKEEEFWAGFLQTGLNEMFIHPTLSEFVLGQKLRLKDYRLPEEGRHCKPTTTRRGYHIKVQLHLSINCVLSAKFNE